MKMQDTQKELNLKNPNMNLLCLFLWRFVKVLPPPLDDGVKKTFEYSNGDKVLKVGTDR